MTGAGGGALMTPMLILPFGAAVHLRNGTVNLALVGWMVLGSVPMAFLGAYLLHLMGHSPSAEKSIQTALGAALLLGATAMILRYALDRRSGKVGKAVVHHLTIRPVPSVIIGMVGGIIVGITSVGSGSLMIVFLLFVYPMLGAKQPVATSLVIGSVPAVVTGSFLSSRASDRCIRPVITFVILASGLRYVGVGTIALG